MKAKLKENIKLIEFLKVIKKCKADVYLETDENDRLNLNSTLSQYVLVVMVGKKEFLPKCTICYDEIDYKLLKEYLAV